MVVKRNTPYPGMNFRVGIAGIEDTDVCEVIFPEARLEVTEYRSGQDKENAPKHLQTLTTYGNLVLRRDVCGVLDWYEWWDAARNGNVGIQRNISVMLESEDHAGVVMTWNFTGAMPVNHQFSPLNALGMEPLLESLELAFERLEME